MALTTFQQSEWALNANMAFAAAKEEAKYSYGNRAWTGTVADKSSFVMIHNMDPLDPDYQDGRVSLSSSPAGCIDMDEGNRDGERRFMFFGTSWSE